MRVGKIKLLMSAALIAIMSGFLSAQSSRVSISDIITKFDSGVLTADQAYVQMSKVYNDGNIHKCATPLHMFEYKHKKDITSTLWHSFKNTKNKSALATFVSASGKFEFTYQTTGSSAVPLIDENTNGIPDYVEEAGIAIDSAYSYLVQTLGHSDPIPNGSTYDITFENLGFYGYVETNGSAPSGTVMVIENDFVGFPENDDPDGDQLGALRATIAHEFKHAVQFAQNDFSGDSDLWAEMDATLAEETVYDGVNDYYNYLGGSGDVFGNPGVTVIPGSYEDVTWALYFHEKYGSDFWPATWERIENSASNPSLLSAIDEELTSRGSNYSQALLELYAWHFTSGTYRNINFGFDESLFYPTPNVQSNITQINDQYSTTQTLGRFAAYMSNVVPPLNQTGNASVMMDADSSGLSLAVVALFKNGSAAFGVADEESDVMVVNEGWQWDEIERLGIVVLNERQDSSGTFRIRISDTYSTSVSVENENPITTELKQNYPNPFNPSTTIPVSISEFQRVKIDIYDMAGRLVQSVFDGNLSNGNYAIPVNMERYASGVYMYRLQTNEKVQIKRMTLVK